MEGMTPLCYFFSLFAFICKKFNFALFFNQLSNRNVSYKISAKSDNKWRFYFEKNWGGCTIPPFFQKIQILFLKIKYFQSSLILLEPAYKIWKWLKNGKLCSLPKFVIYLQTDVFLRIRVLELIFAQNFLNFHKNHKYFFIIWYNVELSIIRDFIE